ncbi:MAG: hypothetical protein D3925_15690 [Candidatus Electrothrix sp. AR5]|nr:hypothetical protein [Candidatus Electrothrix sp. AR5]
MKSKHNPPPGWQKKEWRTNRLLSAPPYEMMIIWGSTLFWNSLATPLTVRFILNEWDKGEIITRLLLYFPVAGLALLIRALFVTRKHLRFGRFELRMDPFPGALGGQVGGFITLPDTAVVNSSTYHIELECVQRLRRYDATRWTQAGNVKVSSLHGEKGLPFCFDVPDDLPETDIKQNRGDHFWRLTLNATLPDTKLLRTFNNLPIFKTGESSCHAHHDLSVQDQNHQKSRNHPTTPAFLSHQPPTH